MLYRLDRYRDSDHAYFNQAVLLAEKKIIHNNEERK